MGWLFFPNFYFLGDVGLSGRLHWEYLLYFLQDHYGFGIGTVFLGSCLVGPFWRESFERYLIVMILVPLLLFVTVTNRTPHVRYVVHLILLSVPLFIKMFQRLERILVRESRLLVLFLVFLVGALLIHDFPARARYIYDGNYGYVHIPGVRTPKYRNGMKFVREHSRTTDRIAVLHWHFFWYIHPIDRARLDRANAHFLLFDSSEARRVLGQISRSESGPDWLVLPVLLKKIMEPDYRRDLKAYCDPVGVPPDWYLDIYRCRTEQVIPSSS